MSGLLRRTWVLATSSSTVWLALVATIDGVIAIIAIAVGPGLNVTGLLSAGPLLACARTSGRTTALISLYALALCGIVAKISCGITSATQLDGFLVVLMSGALAAIVAMIRERREKRLITIADRVQRAILRPLPAELGGVAFASHYQSATPGTLVGGDLYDLAMTQFGPRFIIGDVKGKGLDAVGRCAAVIAAFRELAFAEPDLVKLAEQVDARLSIEMDMEDFVTAIFAEFGAGEVRIANCGHHPPVKIHPSTRCGDLEIIAPDQPTTPLGLGPMPCQQNVVLKRGDRLMFYTDGLVEARNREGSFLDIDDRMGSALAAPGLNACLRNAVTLLLDHTGHRLGDDVLLVVCEPFARPSS
jgi:sigma-B regulation protein RsbU (phosphoserine phosphatase)